MEFIDGAVRLRGNAKALDVWRMETKLEVLMQEARVEDRVCPTVVESLMQYMLTEAQS